MNLLRLTWGEMNLPNHYAWSWRSVKGKRCYKFADGATGSDDRGFLHAQRNHEFFFVDYKLRHNSQREAEHADYVLNHSVCNIKFEASSYEVINLHFCVDFRIDVIYSFNDGYFVELFLIQRNFLVQTFDSLQYFLWRYFIGHHTNRSASELILSPPLLINFG